MAATKLTIPVLTIAGDRASGDVLGKQARVVATNVTDVVLEDTGHWVMEERPTETMAAIVDFVSVP